MKNKLIAITFVFMLAGGAIWGIASPDKYYSESEKRTLTQRPTITTNSIINGKSATAIENYISDQFPMRDNWVTIKSLNELLLGKRENGNVYFADDGYLIDKLTCIDSAQYSANLKAISNLSKKLNTMDIPLYFMPVPTASWILKDRLPYCAPNINQVDFINNASDYGINVINTSDILNEHKEEYIYYKTDHHYTSLGAYYCYLAWASACDHTVHPLSEWNKEVLCNNFRGTTYSKVNYPFAPYDTITAYYRYDSHKVNYNNGNYITDSIYERKYLNGHDQYAVFLNSNQSTTVINGSGNGRLLILKDSYANTFAQFVMDDYSETHLIDMRFYNGSISQYVKDNDITEVLVLYNLPNFASDTYISHCS
ncbi:MAG: DHHW family protein [Lachnospiraceae bacterium]|nr:DHHW family protein [Lachnospiraceae bacterium]